MGGGISPWMVAVLLAVCGVAGVSQVAVNGLPRFRQSAAADERIELVVQEVARCGNGQAVLVLREKDGERRLPVPVAPAEAAALDRRLHGEKSDHARLHDLANRSITALGGRVVRASIESLSGDRVFLGHLSVRGKAGSIELESRAPDSVALALDAGAPIVVTRQLLDQAGVNPSELSGSLNAQKARTSRTAPPAPVYRI
jgi:bifunctional DNase/RNase